MGIVEGNTGSGVSFDLSAVTQALALIAAVSDPDKTKRILTDILRRKNDAESMMTQAVAEKEQSEHALQVAEQEGAQLKIEASNERKAAADERSQAQEAREAAEAALAGIKARDQASLAKEAQITTREAQVTQSLKEQERAMVALKAQLDQREIDLSGRERLVAEQEKATQVQQRDLDKRMSALKALAS